MSTRNGRWRLKGVWRHRGDEDLADEVQAHLDHEIDRLVSEGMSRQDARASALRAFGSPTRTREQFHERSRWIWIEQFAQDLRYAWRGLRASPAFLATTVLTLAAGLGLLTVAFTTFNAYVLRPFAVADPSGLYRIAWRAPAAVGATFSGRAYDELRSRTDLFDAVIADDLQFSTSDGRSLVTSAVSANYFSVLRPRLAAGRLLGRGDESQPVAVLAQAAATRLFGGIGSAALGRALDLDGRDVTIVGVMGEAFVGLDDLPRDVWRPANPAVDRPVVLFGRLRAGVVPAEAEAELGDFAARAAALPGAGAGASAVRAVLVPAGTANPLSLELVAALTPVFSAFALVLLAACVNVSNMMLARVITRSREIALRLSLGASRVRLIRQLLTEGLLVAILAGACALALAAWLLRVATVALFATLPPLIASLLRVVPMPLDSRVFLFAFGAALATTLLFALLPGLQASGQTLAGALRGQQGRHAAGARLRNALVIAQVAVSIVLVVTAVLLARNFVSLTAMDLGYVTKNVYSISPRHARGSIAPLAAALRANPRIQAVAVTAGNPLLDTSHNVAATPSGQRAATLAPYSFVSPEFMPILRLPVSHGRAFRADEAAAAAPVAIVSESTARRLWSGEDPIGRTFRLETPSPEGARPVKGYSTVTIVGTVPDVVSGMLFDGSDAGHIYLPADAANPRVSSILITPNAPDDFRPDMLGDTFRRLGYVPDDFLIISLDEMRATQLYPVRAAFWVGALLGFVALVISATGLYGVLSFAVAQRTSEIGIRMALGATSLAVVGLVMRQTARMAAAGGAIGLLTSLVVLKALSSAVRLRGVSFLDPLSFAAAVALVGAATALAAYYPSRKATRINPAQTLRAEARQ